MSIENRYSNVNEISENVEGINETLEGAELKAIDIKKEFDRMKLPEEMQIIKEQMKEKVAGDIKNYAERNIESNAESESEKNESLLETNKKELNEVEASIKGVDKIIEAGSEFETDLESGKTALGEKKNIISEIDKRAYETRQQLADMKIRTDRLEKLLNG